MLIVSKRVGTRSGYDVELELPFDLRQKSRLRTTLKDGEEIGLFLERGHILRDGEYLEAEDGRVVIVRAKPESILHISCTSDIELIRVAYHLGNRHVALQAGKGWVRIAEDNVLRQMVEGLGAKVERLEAPFEPEAGAYGGHKHHGDDSSGHGGVIHEFGLRRSTKRSG